jgi:hypothetical protein
MRKHNEAILTLYMGVREYPSLMQLLEKEKNGEL